VTAPALKPFRNEAAFQRYVESMASMLGWRSFHVGDARKAINDHGRTRLVGDRGISGFPDLVLVKVKLHSGPAFGGTALIMFRELKLDTGRVQPHQREVLEQLKAAGADVDVWRPADLDRIEQELRR
jgi:hypothetical protein